MLWAEITSIVISVLSLFVSVAIAIIGAEIRRSSNRLQIEQAACAFIINHDEDDQISFLPFCVIANAVNRHHKHVRPIYNDFNALPRSVQKEVISQCGYEFDLITSNGWIDEGLDIIEDFANRFDFGNSFLYDAAKHFHKAFNGYPSTSLNTYSHSARMFDDCLDWGNDTVRDLTGTSKISFSSYLESYYRTFVLGQNKAGHDRSKCPNPFDYLKDMIDFCNCDSEKLAFWMMEIVSELSMLVIRTRHGGFMSGVRIKGGIDRGNATPGTFEDRYYECLMDLYKIHLDGAQHGTKYPANLASNNQNR